MIELPAGPRYSSYSVVYGVGLEETNANMKEPPKW